MLKFIDVQHSYDTKYDLVEDMVEAQQPPLFKGGIQMTPYQLISLQTLLDIEERQQIQCIASTFGVGHETNQPLCVKTSAAVLSEPLGSGKTIIILGLLCSRAMPPAKPSIVEGGIVKYKKWVRPALIKVPKAVFYTWYETISRFTYLKCFPFEGAKHSSKFIDYVASGNINTFDIVLLKDGDMIYSGSKIDIMEFVLQKTEGAAWSRAIYDDYDTIKLSKLAPALFTIFVSATSSVINKRAKHTVKEMINKSLLRTNFNISNKKHIVEKYLNLPKVYSYLHVFKHPEQEIINSLRGFANITEMISDGAVKEISEYFGERIGSVTDVVYAMFRRQINGIKRNTLALEAIEGALDIEVGQAAPNFDEFLSALKENQDVELPATISENQLTRLEDAASGAKGAITRFNSDITDLATTLRENECKVCCAPLNEAPMAIMPCCGITLCNECAVKGNHLEIEDTKVTGRCCGCAKPVLLSNIMFLKETLTADDLLNIDLTRIEEGKQTLSTADKLDALVNLCTVATLEGVLTANAITIMQGDRDAPLPPATPKRILVFSTHDESIEKAKERLLSAGLKVYVLGGTSAQIHSTISQFRETGDILFINGARYCAGLNLQFATSVVYLHEIIDEKIKAQISSRVMRFAREYNLTIHFLMYQHEAANKQLDVEPL